MKYLSLKHINAALLIAAAAMTTAGCANSNNDKANAADAPTAEEMAKAEALNIRFVDADSILAGYELAREFQELTLSQLSRMESTGQARQAELQKMASQIEQNVRNNKYETQSAYEADMAAVNKKQQEAASQMANLERQAQNSAAQRQIELNDSLQSFIKDYNAKKGYDAILYKAAGVYFNPALDITQEVLDGLNERYRKSQKK